MQEREKALKLGQAGENISGKSAPVSQDNHMVCQFYL